MSEECSANSDIPHEKATAQDIENVGVENSLNLDIVM